MTFIDRETAVRLITSHQEISFLSFVEYLENNGCRDDLGKFLRLSDSFRDKLVLAFVSHEANKFKRPQSLIDTVISRAEQDAVYTGPTEGRLVSTAELLGEIRNDKAMG
jgi:hypothetical protein